MLLSVGGCATIAQEPSADRSPVVTRQADSDPSSNESVAGNQGQWLQAEQIPGYSGTGRYRWPDGRTYDGQWLAGKPAGTGTGTLADGSRYDGQWQHGLPHGQGAQTEASGATYRGSFATGTRHGQGVHNSSAGRYQGQWQQNQPHGEGVFTSAEGSTYQGQYQQGNRHGTGRFQSVSESVYSGDWLDDAATGFGILTTPDGARHEGQWLAGQSDGYGVYEHPAGLTYRGAWKAGLREGFGEELRPDGSRYQGDWLANEPHGHGEMHFGDGSHYQGQWHSGELSGRGVRTFSAGYTLTGQWQKSRLASGTLELTQTPKAVYQGALFSGDSNLLDAQAQQWLSQRAAAGSATAASILGGLLQPVDPLAARHWHTQAAHAGITDSQFALGTALLAHDIRGAIHWLNKSSNGKPAEAAQAQFLLGTLYHFGQYLPQDEDQAEMHYQAAIENGSLPARRNLALMLATTSIDYLRDPKRALALIEPIANLYQSPSTLDALASVYAANQRYADAANAQQAAIQALATEPKRPDNAEALRSMRTRLNDYLNRSSEPQAGGPHDPG